MRTKQGLRQASLDACENGNACQQPALLMVLNHAPFRIPGVIAALLLGAATLSSAKPENEILRKGPTDGIFVGIEQGDYAHFQIKNNTGKEESYFLLHPDKSSEAYLDHPEKFKDRNVRRYCQEEMQKVAEAGETMRIGVVLRVEALGK